MLQMLGVNEQDGFLNLIEKMWIVFEWLLVKIFE